MSSTQEKIRNTLEEHQLDAAKTEKANFGKIYCTCGVATRTFKGITALLDHQAEKVAQAIRDVRL